MKVVIVGQGPRSFEHPDDHEVWVINGPRFPPRWDRLFQLHGIDHIEHKHGADYVRWMRDTAGHARIYMTQPQVRVPGALVFPLDTVKAAAGNYLTNSFPMVIAFALLEGATEIILDGVIWAGGAAQWGAGEGWAVPCTEYHIGRARALDVRVTVPPGCGLFVGAEWVYGYEGPGAV